MSWKPVTKHITTPFAETVSPDNALPEHPRPQMVRETWQNLNGLWDYTLEPVTFSATTGLIEAPTMTEGDPPSDWRGQILVPFTIDAPLSGIMEVLTSDQRIWYRRGITVPGNWTGKRILLHFQASDWETSVYINGEKIGQHRGGYDPFTFDITDPLTDGDNELTVCCWDATEEQAQAIGKQIMPENRQGFRYQPTGDIYDIHDYTFYPATALQQCANGRVALLGEAGGFNLCIPGHTWYDHEEPSEHIDHVNDIVRPTYPTPEAMEDDYRFWVENLRAMVGITALNGVVYTQITDVEHELNGWLTYDRKVSKIDPDKLGNIHINGQLIRNLRVRQHSAPISETCTLLYPDEYDLLKLGENVICAVLLPSQRTSYFAVQFLDMK